MKSFLLASAVVLAVLICCVLAVVLLPHTAKLPLLTQPAHHFVIVPLPPPEADTAQLLPRIRDVLDARLDCASMPHDIDIRPTNRLAVSLKLPTEYDIRSARALLTTPGVLEFRMVHEHNDKLVSERFEKGSSPPGYSVTQVQNAFYYVPGPVITNIPAGGPPPMKLEGFNVPSPDYSFLLEKREVEGATVYAPLFVKRRRELSGEYIRRTRVDFSSLGEPVISIEFDAKGAKLFARVTADYAPGGARNPNPDVRRRMAIVIDGRVTSAPVLQEAIFGGKAQIAGRFTLAEAGFLASLIGGGALPCPVELIEEAARMEESRGKNE